MTFTIDSIGSTLALSVVCIGCLLRLIEHVDWHTRTCERWGFVLTAAGAFGEVVYIWWPKVESFPFGLVMHVGMALIAVSILRGRVIGLLSHFPSFRFSERRKHGSDH